MVATQIWCPWSATDLQKPLPICPMVHTMGEDVGFCLDLLWGRQWCLGEVYGKGSKELHLPSKLVAGLKLGCNELGRSLQPSSVGYFCLPAAETPQQHLLLQYSGGISGILSLNG